MPTIFEEFMENEIKLRPVQFKDRSFSGSNPNLSSAPEILNAPRGTFLLQDDDTLWRKISSDEWVEVSSAEASTTESGVVILDVPFDYTSPFPLIIRTPLKAKEYVYKAQIRIETAFDGNASLSLGLATDPELFIAESENDPLEVGVYETAPAYEINGIVDIAFFINGSGITQGSGRVVLTVKT